MRNRIEGGVIHALLACPGLFTRTLKWKKSDAVYYSPFLNNANHFKLVVVLKKKHKKQSFKSRAKYLEMTWAQNAYYGMSCKSVKLRFHVICEENKI